MHKLYREFYAERLFTFAKASKIIKNIQVCKNTLGRLVKKGYIKRIRAGIYYIVPIDHKDFYPDPIHIATTLRTGVICANTALVVYRLIPKERTIYITGVHAAKLRMKEYTYRIFKSTQSLGIQEIDYITTYGKTKIKITDLERTILDCVWNKTLRIEELFQALKTAKTQNMNIDIQKMILYLEKYRKPVLYHKIGFLLEALTSYYGFQEQDLELLKRKVSKKTYYLRDRGVRFIRPRYKHIAKWRVMIPESSYNSIYPKIEGTG
jgi:predicted transcriptional regulator of viral defense system